MISNITLIYYTANLLPEFFADNIRRELIRAARGKPIITVSQKPIRFGYNICLDLKPSLRSIWVQILEGAKKAQSPYIAMCEDDTIYVPDHFDYVPKTSSFAYNINHWHLSQGMYFYRGHRIMSVCVCPRELMIEDAEKRLRDYPGNENIKLRIPRENFETKLPVVTFRHPNSVNGVQRIPDRYKKVEELRYYGNAQKLWEKVYGT